MKRSAIKRRTPLRSSSSLARTGALARKPIRRKPRRARPDKDRDEAYLDWCRRQRCARCDAPPPSAAHHHSMKQRGKSQKAPDRYAFPLCTACHVPGLHALAGLFKGWSKEQLREWQDAMCAKYRGQYEARRAA